MNTRENCLRALGNLANMAIDNTKGSKAVDVCKGRRKTAYGYKWRYNDE